MKRSICFIAPNAYPLLSGNRSGAGGAERQFFLFARELVRYGWDVSFITKSKSSSKDVLCKTEFPVFQADFSYMGGSNKRLLFCWASLWQALKKADSVYYVIKTPAHLMLPVGIFSHLRGGKLIFWTQTTYDNRLPLSSNDNILVSLIQKLGLKMADTVVAQTINQKMAILDNFNLNAELVRSIACSLEASSTDHYVDNFAPDIDVLWVGNTNKNKRVEVLFQLAAMLPDVRFAVAMNADSKKKFEMFSKEAHNNSNIKFLGMVPPAEMESWFQRTRLLLNTSIREGFPNTFLQAWMNGVPVVSINIDPDEVIKKFNLGRVVGIESESAFNENAVEMAGLLVPQIQELLAENALREDIGDRAREYIKDNHTPEVVIPELLRLLT